MTICPYIVQYMADTLFYLSQYVGTCVKPEDAVDPATNQPGPMVEDPEYANVDGRTSIYLTQTRFQKLCEGICVCEVDALDADGGDVVKKGCATIAGPGHFCTCEVCRVTAQVRIAFLKSHPHCLSIQD